MKMQRLAALIFGVLGTSAAYAVPSLQLDIDGGTYVGGSEESTVTNDPVFNLWALGDTGVVNTGVNYYLSIALLPASQNTGDPANFGSVLVNGTSLSSLVGASEYGKPPIESVDNGGELASHGIYETFYYQIAFQWAGLPTVDSYNTADGSAGPAGDELFKKTFQIDASALETGYGLHFDLYTYGESGTDKKAKTKITDFAPFSHDAGYCVSLECEPVTVSEPSTLGLFGIGLLGLAAIRRRMAKA